MDPIQGFSISWWSVPMTDKILSRSEVLKIVGFSARTLYYEIAAGRFPRQVQISKRRVGWRLSDLQAWLDERGAA